MGNSHGSPQEDVVYGSRVIKISESVAERIFVKSGEKAADSAKMPSSTIIEEPPIPRLRQPFREDGNYMDDSLFEEFQRHEVLNELQLRSLHKKLTEAVRVFDEKPKQIKPFVESKEQKQLKECFKNNSGKPLKCHEEFLEFTSFVKQLEAQR